MMMDDALLELYFGNQITQDTLLAFASDKATMMRRI